MNIEYFKNLRLSVKLILSLFICQLIFINCNKSSTKQPESKVNHFDNNIISDFQLKISDLKILTEDKIDNYLYSDFSKNQTYQFRQYRITKNDLNNLNIFDKPYSKLIGIILYTRNKEVNNFNDSNIIAMSVYTEGQTDRLKVHRLFEKTKNGFVEKVNLRTRIANILTNHGEFIAHNFLDEKIEGITYLTCTGTGFVNSIFDELKFKELALEYNYLKKFHKSPYYNNMSVPPGGNSNPKVTCGPNCLYGNPITHHCFEQNMCIENSKNPEKDKTCPKDQSVACLLDSSNQYTKNQLDSIFNTLSMYDFRDNFLLASDLGQFYTRCYYYIGACINEDNLLNLNIATQIAFLMPEVDSVMKKLQNPAQYGQSVLINENLKSNLFSIFNGLRLKSSENSLNEILNVLQLDLEYFNGKTVNEVLADL